MEEATTNDPIFPQAKKMKRAFAINSEAALWACKTCGVTEIAFAGFEKKDLSKHYCHHDGLLPDALAKLGEGIFGGQYPCPNCVALLASELKKPKVGPSAQVG
jgi:predicted RNA-binding Zn-ribbon protein involved in translation (DUF1610 family)